MNSNFRHVRSLRKQGWAGLLLAILLSLLLTQYAGWLDEGGQILQEQQPGLYSVAYFSDGDTIAVNMNGRVEKIRFIGVDTPETHKPGAPVQCYGPAAAAYTKRLIGSQSVRLESDAHSTNRDRYGRLLRYVYLPNGILVNEALVREGYGFYYPYFPFTKSEQFAAAQASAMNTQKGLWSNCHPTKTDRGGYISNNLNTGS